MTVEARAPRARPGALGGGALGTWARRGWPVALIFAWPLIYLFRFAIGDHPLALAVGNDFDVLYYSYKVYLLDVLSDLRLPLWSPSEGGGFPFYANPFTQTFYPLNLLLVPFYLLADGYSALDHQRFTLLGLSIYGLGLFAWLRALGLPLRAALVATLVMSVSFKLTEVVRFPNAVHAAAWMPWILFGLTRMRARPTLVSGAAVVAGATLMLLTAGYPYYAVYAAFLIGPYLLVLVVPQLGRAVALAWPARPTRLLPFATATGLAFALPAGLALPWLLKVGALMAQTVNRGSPDFAYSTRIAFTPLDTVASALFPPAAQAEGWFYFGMSALLLVLLYLAGSLSGEGEGRERERRFRLLLALWLLLIVCVTWGRESYLFRLLWDNLPVFSQMRVWGRLNIVLVPPLALVLARAWLAFEAALAGGGRRASGVPLIGALLLTGLTVLAIQALLAISGLVDPYWPKYFAGRGVKGSWFLLGTALGLMYFGTLIHVAGQGPGQGARQGAGRQRWRPSLAAAALVLLCAIDTWPLGSVQWSVPARSGGRAERAPLAVAETLRAALEAPGSNHYYRTLLTRQDPTINAGLLQYWYFDRYADLYRRHFTLYGRPLPGAPAASVLALRRLLGLVNGRRLYLSRELAHGSPRAFLADADQTEAELAPDLSVTFYDGDVLEAEVDAPEPLYLSFIDNWDPDWTATVDGRPVMVRRLLGTFKSVPVPAGRSRVRLAYRPWPALPSRP